VGFFVVDFRFRFGAGGLGAGGGFCSLGGMPMTSCAPQLEHDLPSESRMTPVWQREQ